jgi:putative transferase (TIGR04331 family)
MLVPLDTEEFLEIFKNDYWNQFIVQGISKNFNQVFYIKSKNKLNKKDISIKKKNQIKFKSIFINQIKKLLNIINKEKYKYFIYKTYLGMTREFLLCLKLGQIPFFDDVKLNNKKGVLNKKLRESLIKKIKTKGKFENYLSKIFCSQMPIVFLEKFNELETLVKNNKNLPKKPKKIFSALSLWGNSAINYYCALKKEENTKIIYAQHGGGYGITKTHFNTDYEIEVCDKYLSYGWSNSNKKILKFGNIHNLDKKKYIFSNKKKFLTFISNKRHKYSTFINSSALWSIDFIDTVKFYSNFLLNLPKNIQENTLIRGMPDTDLKKLDFFGTLIKNFKVDNKTDIFDLYNNSKIIIHSINSTSLLETMYLNIPSIIILDKKIPFSHISKNIFLDLKKNNIFFDDPKLASKFIEKIWENGIHTWWNSINVQKTVKKFNLNFSKRRNNVLSDLQKILVNQ